MHVAKHIALARIKYKRPKYAWDMNVYFKLVEIYKIRTLSPYTKQ